MNIFESMTTAPLAYVLADNLIARRQSAVIYRCPSCASTLVAAEDQGSICGECGGERIHAFSLEDGEITHWHHPEEYRDRLQVLVTVDQRLDLAVLYGSRVRQEAQPLADFELMIEWRGHSAEAHSHAGVELDLARKLGFHVEVVELDQLRTSTLLFHEVLCQGDVLVDRRGRWRELEAELPRVAAAARRERSELARRAEEAHRQLRRKS